MDATCSGAEPSDASEGTLAIGRLGRGRTNMGQPSLWLYTAGRKEGRERMNMGQHISLWLLPDWEKKRRFFHFYI